jgi:diguanylate cyclase (GGDEF)-like protein
MAREKILVVDDEADIRELLRILLETEQYEVIEASDGAEGLEKIQRNAPSLVVLDFKMPKMTGAEVCKEVRRDLLLQHIPIILLTAKSDLDYKVKGINAGADDYMVKPFEPSELLARIRMLLRRTSRSLDANPLTKLPGNNSIYEELNKRIAKKTPFAVCYLDLDKFKAYNDKYGFEKGDEVIMEVARILIGARNKCGDTHDFIGHVGGDDFVIITTPEKVEKLCKFIIKNFDESAQEFYSKEDLRKGYVETSNRQGKKEKVGIISISIAVVTDKNLTLRHIAEITQIAAELKKIAKKQKGSCCIINRRKI